MTGFDWPGMMRAGLQGLRLTPEAFWQLTPAELRLMLGQGAGQGPLGRDGLEKLLAAYPDQAKGDQDGGT